MQFFALYQSGGPIYGIGISPADAERDAGQWLDDTTHEVTRLDLGGPGGEISGALYSRPCSAALAALVMSSGGDVGYDVVEGLLILADELIESL